MSLCLAGLVLAGCSTVSIPVNVSTSHYDGPPVLPTGGADLERPLGIEAGEWQEIRKAMASNLLTTRKDKSFSFSDQTNAISGTVTALAKPVPTGSEVCRKFDMTLERVIGIERWLGTGCQTGKGAWVFKSVHPFSTPEEAVS